MKLNMTNRYKIWAIYKAPLYIAVGKSASPNEPYNEALLYLHLRTLDKLHNAYLYRTQILPNTQKLFYWHKIRAQNIYFDISGVKTGHLGIET